MNSITITALRADERRMQARCASALSQAFRGDPLTRLLCPDDRYREAVTRAVFHYNIRCALAAGGVCVSSRRCQGVVLWMRSLPGVSPPAPDPGPELRALPLPLLRRLNDMSQSLDAARMEAARGEPHLYLSALGVIPRHRRRGVATALLEAVAAVAAKEGLPIWLETLTPENEAFYNRRGFVTVAEKPLEDMRYSLMRRPGPRT